MAIPEALLKVAANDLGTANVIAQMLNPGEKVAYGSRWARFQKIAPRAYRIERGDGEQVKSDEVTSPAVAKMMVIQHVATQPIEASPDSKMSATDQLKATEAMQKGEPG